MVEDIRPREASQRRDGMVWPAYPMQAALGDLKHPQGSRDAPLRTQLRGRFRHDVLHGADGRHGDETTADLADLRVEEADAERAEVPLEDLRAKLPRQRHSMEMHLGPSAARIHQGQEVRGGQLQILERRLLALNPLRVEGVLQVGCGRSMEEPELVRGRGAESESAGDGARDVAQVPPQIHLDLFLLSRGELHRAQCQGLGLGSFLLRIGWRRWLRGALGVLPARNRERCRGSRPWWAPMAVGDHTVNAERLVVVVQRHDDVCRVRDVLRQIQNVLNRIDRCDLALDFHTSVNLRRRRLSCGKGQLPDDDVSSDEMFLLDFLGDIPRLDVVGIELLPAHPLLGDCIHICHSKVLLGDGRDLLALDVGPEAGGEPAARDHRVQRVRKLSIVAAQGHNLTGGRAEVLGDEENDRLFLLLLLPACELVGLDTRGDGLQSVDVELLCSNHEDHQMRVAQVEVRRIDIRDVLSEVAGLRHEGKAHLARVVPVLQVKQGDVVAGNAS
mmetsp:Transcript_66946/g.169859  ORF Transcript_66946/g.169859 Transcript_66946/m.169859 type:complete len:502 (+) Transcript_66946:435-1940(+)